MATPLVLQADALIVHLFVAVNGEQPTADRQYLFDVWRACGHKLGMTEPLPVSGLGLNPPADWERSTQRSQLLAGRSLPRSGGPPTPYVQEALLRREHDTFCITVMREPAPADGKSWTDLDTDWSDAIAALTRSPGVIGSARLYLARLVAPGSPTLDGSLTAAVRARCPAHPKAGAWWERGVVVPRGFAVWEASSPEDDRDERRIVVVAAENQDAALSAWTWVVGGDRSLPRFGQYLLHAAKLRYQHRIWWSAERGFRQARQEADKTVQKLLALVAPQQPQPQRREPSQAELVAASRELVSLQAGQLGLVQTSTSLREMHRTVDIASANLTALSENGQLDGLFADDRSLAAWFGQQLDDDATYLEAARERVTQVGGLTDQLVQRGQQRRQERFNLGLTGVIGAILMVLAAIQSLQYTVPLPPLVKPAVITTLGAAALLASLVVLRFAVPDRRWPLGLVWVGLGVTTAAATWIGVSAFAGATTVAGTWLWAGAGFVVGVAAAALGTPG